MFTGVIGRDDGTEDVDPLRSAPQCSGAGLGKKTGGGIDGARFAEKICPSKVRANILPAGLLHLACESEPSTA
jgi:hypothetical protein